MAATAGWRTLCKDCTLGDTHVLVQVVTSLRTGVIPG